MTSLLGAQLCHPRPELTGRWPPLQLRRLPRGPAIPPKTQERCLTHPFTSRTGLDPKPCSLSTLTGRVKVASWGLEIVRRGTEAELFMEATGGTEGLGGAAVVKTRSTGDLLFTTPGG